MQKKSTSRKSKTSTRKSSSRPSTRAPRRKKVEGGPKNIEIIVNCASRETRIAVLENSKLMEYRVEREERVVGSIFKGIVQNVLPGMDAAFVDLGKSVV